MTDQDDYYDQAQRDLAPQPPDPARLLADARQVSPIVSVDTLEAGK